MCKIPSYLAFRRAEAGSIELSGADHPICYPEHAWEPGLPRLIRRRHVLPRIRFDGPYPSHVCRQARRLYEGSAGAAHVSPAEEHFVLFCHRSNDDHLTLSLRSLDGRSRITHLARQEQGLYIGQIGRASCRERRDTSVTGVQTCALPISLPLARVQAGSPIV